MNILIVDDEPGVRTSMARMIRELCGEYRVREAEDGEEAIALLEAEPADLVLADIRMPAVDGLELSEYIRRHCPETDVVLLTGYAEFEYAVDALRKGVSEYLLKPAAKETIADTVRKAEEKRKERLSRARVDELRTENVLEKRVQDLLYGIPLPYYDEELLPDFREIRVFSVTAERKVLWENPVRFFIKNVLKESLSSDGTPVVIAEDRQVTVVWFIRESGQNTVTRKIRELVREMEAMLKIRLRWGDGGSTSSLSDTGLLFLKSLKEIGLWEPDSMQQSDKVHHLVRSALEIIRSEYASDLSLSDIADRLFVNPNYLSTLFKKETGLTFTQHLIQFRLEAAKRLLRDTHLKIYEICERIGYADPAHFSRIFKSLEGITPYEYRYARQSCGKKLN